MDLDIERLVELKGLVALHVWLSEKAKKDLTALIDEAIARQSVTDEAVKQLVEDICDRDWFCGNDENESNMTDWEKQLIVEALQAYQPWIPCTERFPTEKDADAQGAVLGKIDVGYVIVHWMNVANARKITAWKRLG